MVKKINPRLNCNDKTMPYGLEKLGKEFRTLHMIYRLSHILHLCFRNFLPSGKNGITTEEWFVFVTCANHEHYQINQTELARILLKDKTTITRYLNSLESKGYITRDEDSADRRGLSVSLTSLGKKYDRMKDKINDSFKDVVLQGIDETALDNLLHMLQIIEENIKNYNTKRGNHAK